jgi:8-oxo-dGTP pyrophosphatase MutT (NUDIX family)
VEFKKQLEHYSTKFSSSEEKIVLSVWEFYLQHRDTSPSCFSRSLLSGHFTSSGLVVRTRKDGVLETLLTHHAKLDLWIQPGGHADENPNLLEVATQEVLEETGIACKPLIGGEIIDIDINVIPESSKVPEHLHFDIRYLFACKEKDRFVMSSESINMKWIRLDSIIDCSSYDFSLRKLANNAINCDECFSI